MKEINPKTQYVSFDIFDSLIRRNVGKPEDIFYYVDFVCREKDIVCPKQFVEKRIKADMIAQKKFNGCANINEIYNELHKLDSEGDLNRIKSIEVQLEINFCCKNEKIVALFDNCKKEGKHILIISDMYLPLDVIAKMLSKCGISGYENIYISCERRLSKGKGDLYDIVLKDNNLKPKEITHIGDNFKGDYMMPMSRGIKAYLIVNDKPRIDDRILYKTDLNYRTIETMINNCAIRDNYAHNMGCRYFGPLLLGFIQWLNQKLISDNISSVFFLARDGYIIQQAYSKMSKGLWQDNVNYLYCSRRAFTVPLIWKHPEFEDLKNYIPFSHRLSLLQFVARLGIDDTLVEAIGKQYNLDYDYIYEHFELFKQKMFLPFYNKIKPIVIHNSKCEYQALSTYIKSFNISNKIALVDIGYHGTMQNAFEQLLKELGIEADVYGYYVDIADEKSPIAERKICANGFLDDVGFKSCIYKEIRKFVPLFELAFLAPHGSTKKFTLKNHIPIPELYDFEYDKNSKEYIDINNYQKGALDFISVACQSKIINIINISKTIAIRNYIKLGTNPSKQEAHFWGEKQFFEYEIHDIANPKGLVKYLINPKKLKEDFSKCFWKIGFMKQLLRIKLPYNMIYNALKKIYND